MPTPASPSKTVSAPTRFGVAFARLLKAEGGFNDIAADRGGPTNLGISLRFAVAEAKVDPVVLRALDLDMDGDVDGRDIRKLHPAAVEVVYRRCFWDRLRCGELPPPLDAALFDQAVNGGAVAAVRLLQQAINLALHHPDLVVDGRIGTATIRAASKADAQIVATHFRWAAEARYRAIVRANPSQAIFLNGWVNRARVLGTY
jgi:lysozyme family protein